MELEEIYKELEELREIKKRIKSNREKKMTELYKQLIKPELAPFNEELKQIKEKRNKLYDQINKYYESYIYENDYIGEILAKLFSECTGYNYKYYRKIRYCCNPNNEYNNDSVVLPVTIVSWIPPFESDEECDEKTYYETLWNSYRKKENEEFEDSLKNQTPDHFILDNFASGKIKQITFKPRTAYHPLEYPAPYIFNTPYGTFIDELSEKRYRQGEVSEEEVNDMIEKFASKGKVLAKKH